MSCSEVDWLGSGLLAMDTAVDSTAPAFHLPETPNADRAPRRPAHGGLRIAENGLSGILINRSEGGLLAAFWGRVDVGDRITLHIRVAGREAAYSAEVRWCRPCPDGWLAGLRVEAPVELHPWRWRPSTGLMVLERLAVDEPAPLRLGASRPRMPPERRRLRLPLESS